MCKELLKFVIFLCTITLLNVSSLINKKKIFTCPTLCFMALITMIYQVVSQRIKNIFHLHSEIVYKENFSKRKNKP